MKGDSLISHLLDTQPLVNPLVQVIGLVDIRVYLPADLEVAAEVVNHEVGTHALDERHGNCVVYELIRVSVHDISLDIIPLLLNLGLWPRVFFSRNLRERDDDQCATSEGHGRPLAVQLRMVKREFP